MVGVLKLGSESGAVAFKMVDSANRPAGKTGLVPTVTLSKNGGAFAEAAGAVTEIGNGWYALAADADDRDTLGELLLHAEASGADPADEKLLVVVVDPAYALQLVQASIGHKQVIDQANRTVDLYDEVGATVILSTEETSSADGVTITRTPA